MTDAAPDTQRRNATILLLAAEGRSLRSIAEAAGCSHETVRTVIARNPAVAKRRAKAAAKASRSRQVKVATLLAAYQRTGNTSVAARSAGFHYNDAWHVLVRNGRITPTPRAAPRHGRAYDSS